MTPSPGQEFSLMASVPGLMAQLVEDRVAKTLAKLVVSHVNGTITPQEALSGIALIAGLRALLADLAAQIKKSPE